VTAEYIAFHAADRPDAVAIVTNGRSITYAEFARDIRKFTRALRGLQLPRGSTAAIDCDEPYFNWLLRLAFEQLRVVTASVGLPDRPDVLAQMRDFDIVLSGKSFVAGATRHHPTRTAWLQGVLASGDEDTEPTPEKRPDDPLRIVLTSGTTGTPKKLLYTRRVHESLITRTLWCAGFTRDSRYLLALPSSVAARTTCVRAGGAIVIEKRMKAGEAIATHAITHTTMPPFILKAVLDELPEGFAKPPDLTILSFGAAVSRGLRARALARLATDVCDIYSSNEVDYVSSIRGAAAEMGSIWPGVRVEVVDDHDRPLPFGEVGQIRIRTDNMVHRYLDDPQATARVFKDGWVYAGDVGILHDPHRLQLIGRGDDVLNIGWRKIAPEAIEDIVLKLGEVADVGVCGVPNRDGIEEICIAVSGQRSSDDELLQRITDAFRGFQVGRFNVVKVTSIPRTQNGKVQRKALKDIAAATFPGR